MRSAFSRSNMLTDENPFSLSVGDLMAGLLLIFVLMLCVTMIQLHLAKDKINDELKDLTIVIGKIVDMTQQITDHLNKITDGSGQYKGVDIDPNTGAVHLEEKILFEFGQSALKPDGKKFLKEFIPEYAEALFSEEKIKKEIAEVIIEGHASKEGTWGSNLDLSEKRARAVADYIFDLDENGKVKKDKEFGKFDYSEDLKNFLSVNARSFSKPRYPDNPAANRRVEIHFRLSGWDSIPKESLKLLSKLPIATDE